MSPLTDAPPPRVLRRPLSAAARSALAMLASAALFVATVAWTTGALSLQSLTVSPTDVTTGGTATGTVTISLTKASSTVQLTSADVRLANVPSSVSIRAGRTSETFPVRTTNGLTGCTELTATMGGVAKRTMIFVRPQPTPSGSPVSVTTGSTAVGGQTVSGRASVFGVTAGTHTVRLSSSNTTIATVPASVNVTAAQNEVAVMGSATFPITTRVVDRVRCAVISATLDGTTSRVLIKVFPISG